MPETVVRKPPAWFWIVAVLAFLWEAVGVASYLVQAYGGGPAMQAQMNEAQRTLEASMPAWVMGAYAIAVFAGLFGAIGLLVRRRWAQPLLVVSLIAALAQVGWILFISEALALLGTNAAILPVCIILIGLALVWFARHTDRRGWMN